MAGVILHQLYGSKSMPRQSVTLTEKNDEWLKLQVDSADVIYHCINQDWIDIVAILGNQDMDVWL